MDQIAETARAGVTGGTWRSLRTSVLLALLTVLPIALPAVEIDKTGPTEVEAGAGFDYTLTVTNSGASAVADVSVSDTLPGLVSYTGFSGSGWSCSAAGSTPEAVTCNLANPLDPGSSAVTLSVQAGAPPDNETVSNSADVLVASAVDASDTHDTLIDARADLTVTKVIDDGSGGATSLEVLGGEAVTFLIDVDNAGPSPAGNLRVRDTLPAGFAADASPPGGPGTGWSCTVDDSGPQDIVTCVQSNPVAAGASAPQLSIVAETPETAGSYDNQASAESTADSDPFPHASSTVTVEVFLEADLAVSKSANPDEVFAGSTVDYSYSITNDGPHTATALSLVDRFDSANAIAGLTLPPGSNWTCALAASPPVGTTEIECDLDGSISLAPGAGPLVLTITVEPASVDDPLTLANQAEVNSAERLPDPAGNLSETVEVDVLPSADLSLSRSVPATAVDAEADFSWTLTVSNAGPSLARDLVLAEQAPPDVLITGASGSGWSCQVNQLQGILGCTRASLADGASSNVTVQARAPRNPPVAGDASSDIDFGSASIAATTHDPDTGNNAADPASLTVAAVWALSIDKDSPSALLTPEQSFVYEILVDNSGPSDLVGDLRPLLDDAFDSRLRGTLGVCPSPADVPCWSCSWLVRPALDDVLDTDAGAVKGLAGGWSLAISPDRAQVYVAGRFDDAIGILDRRADRVAAGFGRLDYSGSNEDLGAPRAVAIHPSGRWLAAVSHGSPATLMLFSRDVGSGALALAQTAATSLNQPGELIFSPNGGALYLAESGADRLVHYTFDPLAGTLAAGTAVERSSAGSNPVLLGGVSGLAADPSGAWLYAAAPDDAALVAFALDPVDGAPTPLDPASTVLLDDSSNPVPVRAVAVAADALYIGGGDVLLIAGRSGGQPGATTAIAAGGTPARLLDGITSVAVSQDEDSVYVAAENDRALTLLARDSGGVMRFERSVALPDGLRPNALVLDGNDERLYVAATSSAVDGVSEPDLSAVLTWTVSADGGCGALRAGELDSGNIDALPVSLPAGQGVLVTVFAAVASGTESGTIVNTAELTDAGNQVLASSKPLDVRNATEVIVTKTAPGQRPIPGETFSYTIDVVNNGPASVSGLAVTDVPPVFPGAAAGFVDDSVEWQCTASQGGCCNPAAGSEQCGILQAVTLPPGSLSGHLIDLDAESSVTLTLSGLLHPASDPEGTLENTVELEMPTGIEPFSENDLTDTHTIDITAEADLWLTKESLGAGEDADGPFVEYRLTVGNTGPSAARGLSVSDPFDDDSLDAAGAEWSCDITDPGAAALVDSCCAFAGGVCQATDLSGQTGAIAQTLALAPQARARFLVKVPVSDPQVDEVFNEAQVAAPTPVDDTQLTNNSDSRTTRLLATADLEISKEILAGSSVVPGEPVNFLITVTNNGPDGVPVNVEDLFGPELTEVTWMCDATTPIPGDLLYDSLVGLGDQLANPSAVISSEDGRHVYAAAAGGVLVEGQEPLPATVVVLERNIVPGPQFGSLTVLEIETDGLDDSEDSGLPVEHLAGARSLALSPDQRHLYVAAGEANAVVVFRREHIPGSADFGRLAFVEARVQGSDEPADVAGPVTGLRGAADVRVSADGEHVYVAGTEDHAIVTFRRDPSTGTLAFQGAITAADLAAGAGINGLWGALAVDIAPNDIDLYVSGRGLASGFGGPDWTTDSSAATVGNSSYFVNNTPGIALKWLEQESSLSAGGIADLVLEFDHRFELDWPSSCFDVGVLQISTDDGASWDDVIVAGGSFDAGGYNGIQNGAENNPLLNNPGWCGTSPGYPGFVPVRVDLSGAVGPGDSFRLRFGLGEGDIVGRSGWWIDNLRLFSAADPGNPLLVDTVDAVSGPGNVVHLQRDNDSAGAAFGRLTPVDAMSVSDGVDAGRMDTNGQNLYVGGSSSEVITVFGRNSDTGQLSPEQTVSLSASPVDGIDTDALAGLAALAISEDGEHLVASGAAADRLVVFRRQPFVGTLVPMQMLQPGLPADRPVEGGIVSARGVEFSADGQHVFTVAGAGQVGVFERLAPDPTYGFLEAVFNGADDGFGQDASGLLGARAAALSADGNWLFVAGFGQVGSGQRGSLAVLQRNAGSTEPGQHLRFSQSLRDLQGGVIGLDGALDVMTVGSRDIYVAAERDGAVTHFRQDPATGEVTFQSSYANGSGISGLAGAAAVTASPGGGFVFVAGRFDHAVAVFARDPGDGALTFLGEARDGVGGVTGMLGANALAMSTDGDHLYVAARQSDSVVVFDHDAGSLTYKQTLFDGSEGAVITSPTGIAVSREGAGSEHVLVTSLDGDAVTVLRRLTDPALGDLRGRVRFQQSVVDGVNGADALRSPRGIVVDPANDRVYVVSDDDNALVVLDRNTSSGGSQFGMLTPLEIRRQGTGGIVGLERPYGLAVSTGARRNIYTASLGSQSVAAFVRRAGSSCPASGAGNLNEEVFVAADGTVRLTVSAVVDPGALGVLNNQARLIVGDDVNNTGDQDSDESDPKPLTPVSALSLSKDNGRLSVVAGERDDYRIVIENDGPSHARSVQITDLLSANSQFDADSAEWICRAVGAGLLNRQESLLSGEGSSAGLAGAAGLVWSPAPAPELSPRVYAAGLLGNAVSTLALDPVTGAMTISDVLADGQTDALGSVVNGLRGARDVVVSGDGAHLYVSSQIDNRVLVFTPELGDPDAPEFGRLRLVQTLGPATLGLGALNQPQGMTLSADGANLYLAAAGSGTLYVFGRDLVDGQLELIDSIDSALLPGLGGVSAVVMGPEDGHVYAAGTNSNAVVVFERQGDGSLVHLQTRAAPATPGLAGVSALAASPDGAHFYAAGADDDAIVVFRRDNDPDSGQFGELLSGTVQLLESIPGLSDPRALLVSTDGGTVYAAAFASSSLLAFQRDRESGELTLITRYIDASGQSGLAGAASLVASSDGATLFSGALLDGAVTRFRRAGFSRCLVDSGSGDVDVEVDIAAGGAVIIDLSVDVASDTTGQSCPADLDPERRCIVNTASAEWTETTGVKLAGDQDVNFLSAAARFEVDKTDGLAEFRGLAGATALAGTETLGGHLYVASPGEPGIGVYALDASTGPTGSAPLTFMQLIRNGEAGVSGLSGVSDVLVSPDGRHVYASSELDSTVVAFERSTDGSGQLTWLATYSNNADGIVGLAGARSLAMDSAGEHLYVGGTNANAIVIFRRQSEPDEPGFGTLAYTDLVQNGTDGVVDLQRPSDLIVSPDDRHVYVAARQSDAVVAFRRIADAEDANFGDLVWRQSRRNLTGDIVGLLGVSQLLVSPDGQHLYAAGTGNSAIVRFSRNNDAADGDFGKLTFGEALIDGVDGVSGLAGVRALALLGGGAGWLVATATDDSALSLLERDSATGALTPLTTVGDDDEPGGSGPVFGLEGVRALWPVPGGNRVHAAAGAASAVSVFDRSAGELLFAGALEQGGGGAVPGDIVEYVITVRNDGPSRVVDARVSDLFPPEFESVSWVCQVSSPDSSCPVPGPSGAFSGNINALLTLAAGDSATFVATGQLRPDASGYAVNEVVVTLPAGVVDLGGGGNSAVDDDTIINARADLRVELSGMPNEIVAGAPLAWQLTVHNDGPSAVRQAEVAMTLPEALLLDAWVCQPDVEPGLLELAGVAPGGLDDYGVAALSRDGRHLYAAGLFGGNDALFVFVRDPLTGELAPDSLLENLSTQTVDDETVMIDGLAGARAVQVSPDDAHVYVAGFDDDAVAVFERDPISGKLTFVEVVRDGVGAVDGLAGASALVISADGEDLYVAGQLDNAVAVFGRDPATGTLEFRQVRKNLQGGISQLNAPRDLLLLDDDERLWVAATGSDAIVRFARGTDGLLTHQGALVQGGSAADGSVLDGLAGIRSLALTDDGALVTLARAGSDHALSLFDRPLPDALQVRHQVSDGDLIGIPPVTVAGLGQADQVVTDPSGRVLYVAGRDSSSGLRTISAFVEDPAAGTLQFLGVFDGGSADPALVSRVAVSSDGRQLYLSGGDSLDRFRVQAGSSCARTGSGQLIDRIDLAAGGQVVYNLSGQVLAGARGSLLLDAQAVPSAAGVDLHLTNNVDVAAADIVAASALRVNKQRQTDPLVAGEPVEWSVTVSNDGPSRILGVSVTDLLPALPGNVPDPGAAGVIAGSGAWSCTGTTPLGVGQTLSPSALAGVRAMAVSPDGLWAVAAGADSATLVLYQRDPAGGWLTEVDRISDGDDVLDENDELIGTVSGLEGAADAVFSADGRDVYLVSASGNSITRLAIDADSATLVFGESQTEGSDGVIGLLEPVRVVLGPAGDRLIVAARASSAVTVFERDADTGALTWAQSLRSGIGLPLNVLDGVRELVIAPNGRHVYAAAAGHDAIVTFAVDDDGALAYVGRIANGDTQGPLTVVGLGLVQSLAISPQGRHLYAASLSEDAVTVFARDPDTGLLSWSSQVRNGFDGVSGLDGASALLLDSGGELLHVGARNSGGVVTFERTWTDGSLRQIDRLIDSMLSDVRRLVATGSGALTASPAGGGTLLALDRQNAAFCGSGAGPGDDLFDWIDLAPGASVIYGVEAVVHPGARGTLVNTAEAVLPPGVIALTPDDQTDSDSGPIEVVTDLEISKTISGDTSSLVSGGPVRFVLDIGNDGPSHAFGARLIDLLPPTVGDVSWTCETLPADSVGSGCPSAGSGSIDALVDVAVGERLLVIVDATIDAQFAGELTNTGEIQAPVDGSDPDLDNNSSTVNGTVSAVGDLSLVKTGPAEALPGELVSFTIEVANTGPSDATAVDIIDLPPAGLELIDWTCSGSGCPAAAGTGALDVEASVPAAGSLVFTVNARIDPALAAPATLVNQASATLTDGGSDPVPANNSDSASVEIGMPEASVALTKDVDLANALPGDGLVYEISVSNTGPSQADAVRIVDAMPAALTGVTWTCQGFDGASCPGAAGSGDIDATVVLPPGGTLQYVVNAQIRADVPAGPDERVINQAFALMTGSALDPDDSDNTAIAVTVLDLDVIFRDRLESLVPPPEAQP
ncbi:MAG: beta-propeller fold lactonase family protein [Pseudomonadota bacterium]|nr:MAG: beta-propeller fold lactonase family protein [Pseudomonadota bacterium]